MSTLRDEAFQITIRLRQAGHLAYWVEGALRTPEAARAWVRERYPLA